MPDILKSEAQNCWYDGKKGPVRLSECVISFVMSVNLFPVKCTFVAIINTKVDNASIPRHG